MKKTTYALIALIGLLFAGIFVIVLLLRFNQSTDSRMAEITVIEGEPNEHRLEPFTSIRLEDSDGGHMFFADDELSFDDLVHIVISDSVAAPTITLSDGWDGVLEYAVEDSALTVRFLDGNPNIEPSDITIVTPSLSSLYIGENFPTEIVGGTVSTLTVEYHYHLHLGKLKAEQVIAKTKISSYSESTVHADEAEIGYLELDDISAVTLYSNERVNTVCVSAGKDSNYCDISIIGSISGTLRTHAVDQRQEFRITTLGNNTFTITE